MPMKFQGMIFWVVMWQIPAFWRTLMEALHGIMAQKTTTLNIHIFTGLAFVSVYDLRCRILGRVHH
jgi:hypothetical protein